MNFAFAICCLAAVVVIVSAEPKTAAEINADIAIKAKECAAEFKILQEDYDQLHAATVKSTFDASDKLKCYSKCYSEKNGLFDGDKVNVDRVVEVYVAHGKEESKIRDSVAICKEKVGAVKIDCNTSWAMYACFADNL